MIEWGNRCAATRTNKYRDTERMSDYVGNLKAHIVKSDAITQRVIAEYKQAKKVITIVRNHKDSLKCETGWTNSLSKALTFKTWAKAEKYLNARKLLNARVVMLQA